MKHFLGILFTVTLVLIATTYLILKDRISEPALPPVLKTEINQLPLGSTTTESEAPIEPVKVIAENLTVPWEVVFLPDGEILVTERPGRVVLLSAGLEFVVDGVQGAGEGGLLGAALHPDFITNRYVYLYLTTEVGVGMENRIVRYTLNDNEFKFDRMIVDGLPGARFHDGGRIAFGPDGFLYATVGDAVRPEEASKSETLEGTIIRLTAEGEPAPGNPFDSYVYSYGHRNPQGLAWDSAGNLWSSEHGRSGVRSGFDEINLITRGGDYGWQNSEGDTVFVGTIAPARHSTADTTWAPGDLAYLNGSLYLPGLRGETLYEAVLEGREIVAWHEHLVGEYGRLRTVVVGPDNLLYLTTSNRDGRGDEPAATDDKIIRIDPTQLKTL
jgi:glucose/arabinose dehydrogenase